MSSRMLRGECSSSSSSGGDALLLDAHQLLSELMGDETMTVDQQQHRETNDDDDDAMWPQRSSDALMDAVLFEDIEALLGTAGSELATAIELQNVQPPLPPPSQHQQHEPSLAGYCAHSDASHTQTSTSLANVVDWLSTAQPSDDVAEPSSLDDDMTDADVAHTHERELLEREIKFLEAQRDFLQFKAEAAAVQMRAALTTASVSARTDAERAKHELDVATRHSALLADLARQQQQSVQDLGLLLMHSPLNHYRIALMTPMESHIKLCRDPQRRRATLLAVRDSKIDATRQFVEYQAQHIDPTREFFYLDTFEQFGKFYTVDFSVSRLHAIGVDEVAEIIQDHFVTTNDGIAQMLGCVTNREFFDGLEMTFLNARTVDRVDVPKHHVLDRGFVVQESNTVYYRKNLGDVTVMMCDYIDDDELHPYRTSGRIRKDISVGIVLSPSTGADGSPSVVMKRFSFIKHHFGRTRPAPEVLHAISTRVILWGQAVRTCILRRRRPRNKAIWLKYAFPRVPQSAAATAVAASATTDVIADRDALADDDADSSDSSSTSATASPAPGVSSTSSATVLSGGRTAAKTVVVACGGDSDALDEL